MNPPGEPPVIAIIGAGEMGAAVGRRLREACARILISLNGRSAASADRVRRAGLEVVHDDRRLTDGVDYILSIVPPAAALEVAEGLRISLRDAASPPLFVDCKDHVYRPQRLWFVVVDSCQKVLQFGWDDGLPHNGATIEFKTIDSAI
jgi:hypothetical protein